LVDVKGADVNATESRGLAPLHVATSLGTLNASLDRGANPMAVSDDGDDWTSLMNQAHNGGVDILARLLQYPSVRASIDMPNAHGMTAHQLACDYRNEPAATPTIHLLLQAGANPHLTDRDGETPLESLRHFKPTFHTAIAYLEQVPDAEKTSLLVKARRLAVFAVTAANTAVAPSYLQGRVARGQPLPRVALTSLAGSENDEEDARKMPRRKVASSAP